MRTTSPRTHIGHAPTRTGAAFGGLTSDVVAAGSSAVSATAGFLQDGGGRDGRRYIDAMAVRIGIALALIAISIVVAFVLPGRRPLPPPGAGDPVPLRTDPGDFPQGRAPRGEAV